jgi:geranylgeranyl reductase family protein
MKDKATMTTCQESGKGGRNLRKKRMTSKIKKVVLNISKMHHLEHSTKWQSEADSISDQRWDVVIAGAGPAGAMAAAHLASRHHRVLLLDRKKFPREKVCGDGLLPDALRCLDAIGVGEKVRSAGHLLDTSVLVSPSLNKVEIPGEYLTIKRCLLDLIVAQKAVEVGTVFALGEVQQLAIEPDRQASFTIRGCHRPIRSKIGIIATGTDVRLMHKMNWSAKKGPSAVAVRCYVHSSLALDRLIISFHKHDPPTVPGYGWIFPMRNHEFNVGFGIFSPDRVLRRSINLKDKFNAFIESFSPVKELMQQSDTTTPLQAAALRYDFEGAYPFVKGPIVAVGETIGTTLPFIGEGTGRAMESGKLAADAVSKALNAGDLSILAQYGQKIESEFKTLHYGYRLAERWLARPRINDFLISRFGSSRYAQEILAGVIAETRSPQEIFSLKGLLKTFFK